MSRHTRVSACLAVLLFCAILPGVPAAQAEPYLGEIRMFAGNFAPRGWAICAGQLLPISQNTALFSVLGTMYGGDGSTNFALPDLRGRFPVGVGQGSGLTERTQGVPGGEESVTLTAAEMPSHSHRAAAQSGAGNSGRPGGRVPAADDGGYSTLAPDRLFSWLFIQHEGGGQPHDNMPPHLGINFIIALQGLYPSQN